MDCVAVWRDAERTGPFPAAHLKHHPEEPPPLRRGFSSLVSLSTWRAQAYTRFFVRCHAEFVIYCLAAFLCPEAGASILCPVATLILVELNSAPRTSMYPVLRRFVEISAGTNSTSGRGRRSWQRDHLHRTASATMNATRRFRNAALARERSY